MTDLGTTLIKSMGNALAFARGERDDLKVHYFFQNETVIQNDGRFVVYTLKVPSPGSV